MRQSATRQTTAQLTAVARTFIVFVLVAAGETQLAVAAWTIEPVDLSGQAGPRTIIELDSTNNPQAAYFSGAGVAYSIRTGGTWSSQGIVTDGQTFALDNGDLPFFATRSAPSFGLVLNRRLPDGSLIPNPITSAPVGQSMWLGFDSQNRPHLAYTNTLTQLLRHAVFDGSTWNIQTVATDPNFQFQFSSFAAALDANDQVHFAWDTSANGPMKYARPSGAGWQIQSIPNTGDGFVNDMLIDDQGNVQLALDLFTGQILTGGLHYDIYDGTTWTLERVPGLDSFVGSNAQLMLDPGGEPHFLTFDSDFIGPNELKHVYRSGANWNSELITSWDGPNNGPLAATSDGWRIHALYVDDQQNVYYATSFVPEPHSLGLILIALIASGSLCQLPRRIYSLQHSVADSL